MSRADARMLLQRLPSQGHVLLDFAGVELIGQGFADEAFRVFANAHPELTISAINAAPAVRAMIVRAGGRVENDLHANGNNMGT